MEYLTFQIRPYFLDVQYMCLHFLHVQLLVFTSILVCPVLKVRPGRKKKKRSWNFFQLHILQYFKQTLVWINKMNLALEISTNITEMTRELYPLKHYNSSVNCCSVSSFYFYFYFYFILFYFYFIFIFIFV